MDRLRAVWSCCRLDVALIFLFLAVVAPFVQELTAQGAARYGLTAALAEQGTWKLDDYEPILSVDRVELDGHIYSDKAPGQPVLGVPVLAAAELLGAEPATDYRTKGNLGLWSQTLLFCTVPGAILLVLMRREADRHGRSDLALLAALGLSFSTMLLPFSSNLWGHVFAATLGFGAWYLLAGERPSTWANVVAGVLLAVATISEYPMVLVAGVLGLQVLVEHGFRRAVVLGIPHVVVAGLIIAHNRAVYGTNATGYTAKSSGGKTNFLHLPKPEFLFDIFFGLKGFMFTPVVLVAVAALVQQLWCRNRGMYVPAGVFVAFLVLQSGWSNPWGGDGPGPRYLIPALPFLVLPLTHGFTWLSERIRLALVGIGVVSMGLALVTLDLVPIGGSLIASHLQEIADTGFSPTLFTMAVGPIGWVLHAALVVVAVRVVAVIVRDEAPADDRLNDPTEFATSE